MSRILKALGIATFWLTWPGLWLILRWSHRTRLLLICGDEFLVLRGWLGSGEWGLPGGGLHRNENPVTGLLREVREETSIQLSPTQVTQAFEGIYRHKGLRFNFYVFIAELDQKPTVKPQPREIAEISWQQLHSPAVPVGPDAQQALEWRLKNR